MTFLQFHQSFKEVIPLSINQIRAISPQFNTNNLTRWTKQGLLIKLRNGYYLFPEHRNESYIDFFIANRIYRPSYVSLHTALAFYGVIPEAVTQVTSVSTLKTAVFTNNLGTFSYHSIQPALLFGYETRPLKNGRNMLLATSEKAILDLLYLYPEYNDDRSFESLRLDDDFMENELDLDRLLTYTDKFNNHALTRRVRIMLNQHAL